MKKIETKVQEPTPEVDKKPTVAEVIENLKVQISQYQTMMVKAQGALEVLTQLEES
jgi:hypothetical protein